MKKNIVIFLFSFFILTLISCLISKLSMDGIWCHGFSYNIASGLIPYRDFNMVIGPVYSSIIAIFIRLFGNYIAVFNMANSLIFSIIMVFIYKKLNKEFLFLILTLFLTPTIFGYNTFCAFLVIAILMLEDSEVKYKYIFIGLLIGIIVMTKQNIGLILFLVSFMISKDRVKLILGFIIPVFITCLYLICNNAFLSYIDLCYFGLSNFLDNFYIDIFSCLVLFFVVYALLKLYLKNRDKKILYVLSFLILVFPIVDQGHVMPAIIPSVYYIILVKSKKIIFYLKYFLIIGFIAMFLDIILFYGTLGNNFLKFQRINTDTNLYLSGYTKYINSNNDKKIYYFLDNAYMIKLYLNQNPSFYDLINDGNLGSNPQKYIEQLNNECKNDNCIFVLDKIYFKKNVIYTQISPLFKEYVIDNANYFETLPSGDRIYINY